MQINQSHLDMLEHNGHIIREYCLEQGYVVVNDFILCMGGGKRWKEVRPLRLTTHNQVLKYIVDRD